MKSWIAGIASAVVVGIIMLLVSPFFVGPERAALTVESDAADFTSARSELNQPDPISELIKTLPGDRVRMEQLYALFSAGTTYRLTTFHLRNNGSVRSGALEMIAPQAFFWYDARARSPMISSETIKLDPLNPGDDRMISLVGLGGSYVGYVRALEDGHLLPIQSSRLERSDHVFGLVSLYRHHQVLFYILGWLFLTSLVGNAVALFEFIRSRWRSFPELAEEPPTSPKFPILPPLDPPATAPEKAPTRGPIVIRSKNVVATSPRTGRSGDGGEWGPSDPP
jgi:hypothetical protein